MAYTYNPLKEPRCVRFVRLMPANGGPVTCQIFRAHLDDKTEFIALSYAWGSTRKTKFVIANGRKLLVTDSLHSALLRFRLQNEPRVFWIDAICINQEDIAERNRQVSMIREVYMKAQQLYIWLGPGDQYSTSAVESMHTFAEAQRALINTGVYKQLKVGPDKWQAFSKFLQRSWWERMWVIQELCFSEKDESTLFLCGTHKFVCDDIKDACEWCNQLMLYGIELTRDQKGLMEDVYDGVKRVLVLFEMTKRTTPEEVREELWRQWLLAKLADTRDRKATDPRDRIFALYGFLHHEGQPAPVADYSKSVGKVFQEFALEYILSCKSLDVLSEVEEPALREFTTKVPSWVPNWAVKTDRTPLLRLTSNLGTKRRDDQACGAVEPVIFSLNDHVLLVDGIWFDEIAEVSQPLTQEQLAQVRKSEWDPCLILDLWKLYVSHCDPYPTGVPAIEAYYKTLICGREDGDRHAENFVAFWKSIQAPTMDMATFCVSTYEVFQLLCRKSSGAHMLSQMHEMCSAEHYIANLRLDTFFSSSPRSVSPMRYDGNGKSNSPVDSFPRDNTVIAKSRGPEQTLSAHFRYASHKRFRDLVMSSATNRVLITTGKGYIGLAVAGTVVGDAIAVFSGGKTPMVLRKAEVTDRRYMDKKPPRSPLTNLKTYNFVASIIGEAYIHGIMKGEAIKAGIKWDRIALV